MHRRFHLRIAFLIASAAASPAMAQGLAAVPNTMTPIYIGNANMLGMIDATRSTLKQASPQSGGFGRQATPSSQGAFATDLSVARNPAVSDKVRRDFLSGIAMKEGQAAADAFGKRVGNIRASFGQIVAPYGLRNDSLADAMTAYMVMLWMGANRQIALPQVAEVQGLRGQMRNFLAGRAIDEQQRQSFAETLMYQTYVMVSVRDEAAQGHPERMARLAAEIEKSDPNVAASMRQFNLTRQGFERH